MARTRRTRLGVAVAALAMVPAVLAACGGGSEGSDEVTVTPGTGASVTDSASTTDLTIVVDDGAGKKTTWRLTCDPAGGDHPNPEAACRALAERGEKAMPPVKRDAMCTAIFGGPEKATVTGTWQGKPVSASFSKTNGCEISRWKALDGLLPSANA